LPHQIITPALGRRMVDWVHPDPYHAQNEYAVALQAPVLVGLGPKKRAANVR